MRRKTRAKRLLDLEYEDEEPEDEEEKDHFDVRASQSLWPRQAKRGAHTHPINAEVAGDTPCQPVNGAAQKLNNMADSLMRSVDRSFKLSVSWMKDTMALEEGEEEESPKSDIPPSAHALLEECTLEFSEQSFGSLQSRSKAELVAMVLSMQSEMDSLREQIRCLTASGKLANTLESLIQANEQWSGRSDRGTTSAITPLGKLLAPAGPAHWTKMEAYSLHHQQQERHCRYHLFPAETQNGGSHSPVPPLYQEFITAELLERCNTGTTAQKLTNDLLVGLYDRDCLASHSISGVINSKRGHPKPALPAEEVQAILRAVQHYFPGKTDSEIKGYIRQKLQNEAKRLRKLPPHLLHNMKEESKCQGEESSSHA